MKKILGTVFMCIVLIGCLIGIRELIVKDEQEQKKEEERVDAQWQINISEASKQQCRLQESFDKEYNGYPDYYGGTYLDEEGHLVICVTDDYDKNSGEIQEYTGNTDSILENVKYSYNTLQDELDKILEKHVTLYNTDKSINGVDVSAINELLQGMAVQFIDEKTNALVFYIADLDEEKIETFQTIMSDKEFIRLESGYTVLTAGTGNGSIIDTMDADDGSGTGSSGQPWYQGKIIYTSGGWELSTGYPVYFKKNGVLQRGFITAGHGCEVNDTVYSNKSRTNKIGICINSELSSGLDAALIQMTGNYSISQITAFEKKTLKATIAENLKIGSDVYKEGAETEYTSGKVKSLSMPINLGYMVIQDLIMTDMKNHLGDSGGVAYDSNGNIIGSVIASTFNSDGECIFSYICKAENVCKAFECSVNGKFNEGK